MPPDYQWFRSVLLVSLFVLKCNGNVTFKNPCVVTKFLASKLLIVLFAW